MPLSRLGTWNCRCHPLCGGSGCPHDESQCIEYKVNLPYATRNISFSFRSRDQAHKCDQTESSLQKSTVTRGRRTPRRRFLPLAWQYPKMPSPQQHRHRPHFNVVALTFPDARAAKVAEEGPLWADLQTRYPQVQDWIATTDPYGCRVGSGGGTLAVLGEVLSRRGNESSRHDSLNILILHAGGQSSRCPTQMCFGKAWTTFPTAEGLVTPIHIWLAFMFQQLPILPAGSIAVIAADTMLRIPPSSLLSGWDDEIFA